MRWPRAGCWMLVCPSGATARPRAGGGRPGAAERRCLSPGAPGLLRGEEESRRHKLPRGGPPRHPALDGTSLGASDSARPALTCLARSFQTHGRFGFCFLCLRLVVPQMWFAACHRVPRTSRAESLLATYLGSQLPQLQNGDKTPHGEQTFLMGIRDNQQGHLNEASGDLTQNQ